MPITVECNGCGKRLNVKDELVGKKLKCPKCGNTFLATATSAAAPKFPGASSRPAPDKEKASSGPSIHISPGIIALIAAAIIVPTILFIYHVGPGAVQDTLTKNHDTYTSEIDDVVTRIIQSYLSNNGLYNPRKAHNAPRTYDVTLLTSPMYMSMPDSIGFAGSQSEGAFHGQYHPKTHEITVDVEIGGSTLPTGIIMRHGDKTIHGTGHSIDGKIEAFIDGVPAEIHYPPKDDDQ